MYVVPAFEYINLNFGPTRLSHVTVDLLLLSLIAFTISRSSSRAVVTNFAPFVAPVYVQSIA